METDTGNLQPHISQNRDRAGGEPAPIRGRNDSVLEVSAEKMKVDNPEDCQSFGDIEPEQPLHRIGLAVLARRRKEEVRPQKIKRESSIVDVYNRHRMKSILLPVIALLAAASLPAFVRAGENKSISISGDSFAAIAYSPKTGNYAYVYDLRSRAAAEREALEKCGEGAESACWVNKGFCALALGSDKSCWGIGYSYGNGASTDKAKNEALADCRNRTSGAHIAVVLSSDGQHIWDQKDHTTVIDKNGNVYDGRGNLIKPGPSASASPTPGENK
jgi:hypothetical protein